MRKRFGALRRRYQKTRGSEELRQRRVLYQEAKTMYAAKLKNAKIQLWDYLNMTNNTNLWNEVYKLAAAKRKNITQITTLSKSHGLLTADLNESAYRGHARNISEYNRKSGNLRT